MFVLGIITDVAKFDAYLVENQLSLDIERVEAVGYEGKPEFVPITDKDLFICCTCKSYSNNEYDGRCSRCEKLRCYNCAIGDNESGCSDSDGESDRKKQKTS